MPILSIDPRVTRQELLPLTSDTPPAATGIEHGETFEVFHQKKRGQQHSHVGIVHANDPDMALLFAKEQYGRRGETANIWVVRTRDVFATDYADSDAFDSAPTKTYREASAYKTVDRIKAWQAEQKANG